jgi:hypothetical protein
VERVEERCRDRMRRPVATPLLRRCCRSSAQQWPVELVAAALMTAMAKAGRIGEASEASPVMMAECPGA